MWAWSIGINPRLLSAMASAKSFSSSGKKCRVCSDFKSWTKVQSRSHKKTPDVTDPERGCPVDREELGRATWTFLHTTAAYYPELPSKKLRDEMAQFITSFSCFYPCEDCAQHMQARLENHPPAVNSQTSFAWWMCDLHNEVNERLGKPIFDCSKVNERWKDGWKDGSCD